MTTGYRLQATARVAFAALMLTLTTGAFAQQRDCIELKTSAETEQEYLTEQGQKATRLVSAGKVVPGKEVIWTVTAKNVCDKPAENIVIANAVPEHMSYVANSAMGVGTQITYSVDGKAFNAPDALNVNQPDGSSRLARADEYRAVRWTYQAAFAPGATAFVRYRALVQ